MVGTARLEVTLALLGALALGTAAEAAEVRVTGGFPSAARDRWTFVRFDLRTEAAGPAEAVLELRYESGRIDAWREGLEPLSSRSVLRYGYEGSPDPVIAATARLGEATARWDRPDGIPPTRLAVVITDDEGRALPVRALLSARRGLGVTSVGANALPDRWLAWRGVVAVVGWGDELPGPDSAEGRALRDYVRSGGTVLLYRADDSGHPFAEASGGRLGRGEVVSMGRGGLARPPALPERHPPPPGADAPMLIAHPAPAPMGWLLARVAWFVPLCLFCLSVARSNPLRAFAGLAIALVGASWAPTAPSDRPEIWREARWSDPAGGARRELALVPDRSGPVRFSAPVSSSVTALDPDATMDLAMDGGDVVVPGRWGVPIHLLVETVDRAR